MCECVQLYACQYPEAGHTVQALSSHKREQKLDLLCSAPTVENLLTEHNESEDRLPEPVVLTVALRTGNESTINVTWMPVGSPNGGLVLYYEIQIFWHLLDSHQAVEVLPYFHPLLPCILTSLLPH